MATRCGRSGSRKKPSELRPSSAPGIAGIAGRPPVAMMMWGASQGAAAGGDRVGVEEAGPRAHQFDVALGEVGRVDAVQAVHVGIALVLEALPVMAADLEVEAIVGGIRERARPGRAAFHMIFLGTQPTLTQVPPRGPDSASATRAPYSAARWAEASPPLPPPMTTKSNVSLIDPRMRAPAAMLYEAAAGEVPERNRPTPGSAATMGGLPWTAGAWKTPTRPGTAAAVPEDPPGTCRAGGARAAAGRNRARLEALAAARPPDLRQRRGADGGAAPPHLAHLVPGQPPERGAQLRGPARQLQRLPAAAVGLLHRPCPERAAVPGLPARAARRREPRWPRCSASCSSIACATSAWPASGCRPSARSASRPRCSS